MVRKLTFASEIWLESGIRWEEMLCELRSQVLDTFGSD
jgi:hypothetical protein